MWKSIKETPPEQMLEVRDEFGNEAYAEPCYYPFRVEPDPENPQTWGSKVVPCEPEWDGSWMILAENLENPLKWPIVEWRKIEQDVFRQKPN